MADIMVADHQHHKHTRSIGGLDTGQLRSTAPSIEMVANPVFSFPMRATETTDSKPAHLMPASSTHRRTASALPSFAFNPSDTSGRRHDEQDPPQTPDEDIMAAASAASKRGHRRGGSEYVGGDSRFGVSHAISSSPTKTLGPQLPLPSETGSPAKRRSHAHRRSVAVSSHDLSHIMSAPSDSPRLSSSLPSSPMEDSVSTFQRSISTPVLAPQQSSHEASRDGSPSRPPSRPRVEFSEEVEIIPRPLSTISSETEGSFSTIRGHSVNDSITSVLSLAASSSPASPRARGQLEPALASITEPKVKRTSVELSKRLEREGEWLKSKASDSDVSQSTQNAAEQEPSTMLDERGLAPPPKRRKRQSLGQTFGFDRRRSEPAISVAAAETSRLSAISLQDIMARETETQTTAPAAHERRFSGHRLKQWVSSKLHRRSRDSISVVETNKSDLVTRPESAESVDVPGKISVMPQADRPVAETDLDAVFDALDDAPVQHNRPTSRLTFDTPLPTLSYDQSAPADFDDSVMLDLDAATEPLRTPPIGGSSRRQLHSDRASKQLSTSGGFVHRRAESEPALVSFSYNRTAASSQKSMEDVFEEDEEEDAGAITPLEERGMGISVVDSDDGLTAVRRQTSRERPSTSYHSPTPRLFVPSIDRPASLIDETIIEESSPVDEISDGIDIVQAHEEPRAPSLEKLSDSSEASTLLGASLPALPDADHTSEASHIPIFTSSDLGRRQGSFEASRVGTSASSLADTRTTSSCTTGDGLHETRMSVDDVPSLTSSRSTMMSTMHANGSRREFSEPLPRIVDPAQIAAKRKKRASIQSLSQLMSGPFGSKSKLQDESRPQTASMDIDLKTTGTKKRDNRLKKLLFWRSRQSLREAALTDGAP